MSTRIARYMETATGAQCLGLSVRGVRVLLTPADSDGQAAAETLALAIAALGPEVADPPPSAQTIPIAAPAPVARGRRYEVGDRVWCTVRGAEGWCTVTEVGVGRNQGRIKITGERMWCPASNFRPDAPV